MGSMSFLSGSRKIIDFYKEFTNSDKFMCPEKNIQYLLLNESNSDVN